MRQAETKVTNHSHLMTMKSSKIMTSSHCTKSQRHTVRDRHQVHSILHSRSQKRIREDVSSCPHGADKETSRLFRFTPEGRHKDSLFFARRPREDSVFSQKAHRRINTQRTEDHSQFPDIIKQPAWAKPWVLRDAEKRRSSQSRTSLNNQHG